jgi:CelD/BcsL family acetyltransferase involved in cellulose biosynthesis
VTPPRVEVLERLGPLAHDWDALVEVQPLPSPFLRSWWIDHAAEAPARIVTVFDGDRLLGGAAFQVDRIRRGPLRLERVRMLGQGVLAPDHLDLIAEPGRRRDVARAVLGWLRRRGSRLVDLDGLAAEGALAALFAPEVVDRHPAPRAGIADGAEAYLATLPGRLRSTVSRSAKRLAREGVSHRVVGVEEAAAALERLAALHEGRWREASTFLDAWPRFAAAARVGIERGDVVVHELVDAQGEVVAAELDLLAGDVVAFYQAGRRTEREWRGCGSALRAEVVRWAAGRGARTYDLLRGDEPYKADWATGRLELVRCRTGFGPLGRAQAALAARRAATRVVTS